MQHTVIHNQITAAPIQGEQRLVAVPVPAGTSQTGTLLVLVKLANGTVAHAKITGSVSRTGTGYPSFGYDAVEGSGTLDLEVIADGMVQAGSLVGYLDVYATGIPAGAKVDVVFSM